MTTLIELSSAIQKLEEALTDIDEGEEQEQLIHDYLQSKEDIKTKLDGYGGLITELEARSEMRKAEAKRLSLRATVDSNLAKRLKALLLLYMQSNDLTKVETRRYQISKTKNGGKVALIVNEDFSVLDIAPHFQKHSVDFDRDEIRWALEQGEELPFARLEGRKESVKIK